MSISSVDSADIVVGDPASVNNGYRSGTLHNNNLNNTAVSTSPGSSWRTRMVAYFKRVLTREFIKTVILGQLLSLLICSTAITSQMLYSDCGVSAPTAQSFLNYILLTLVYCPILACRSITRSAGDTMAVVIKKRWWIYIIVAIADVEANYLVVKAYQYTTLTSIQLLDCVTIPVVILLSYVMLKMRYRWVHILSVAVCMLGVGTMVGADILTGRAISLGSSNRLLGDVLCLTGASLYGVSNVAEEYTVKHHSRVEFLAMLGMVGSFINGFQLVLLERNELASIEWNLKIVGLALAFSVSLFVLYSVMPVVMRISSATAVNLSILTADLYSLLLGLFLFHYQFNVLYFVAFVTIAMGVVLYNSREVPYQPSDSGYDYFSNRRFDSRSQSISEPRYESAEPNLYTETGSYDVSPPSLPDPEDGVMGNGRVYTDENIT